MHDLILGSSYLIRTSTYYYTGRLVELSPGYLILEDAAWIADTGRFAESLRTGVFAEVEPYPDGYRVRIPIYGNIADICDWKHPLPRETK